MAEPYGWDDPRKNPEERGGESFSRRLLRRPDEQPPSPRILKLALLAAAIIVVIALILYFKARKAPPALRDELRTAPASLYACDTPATSTSNRGSWLLGEAKWKRELTASKLRS